MAAAAQSIPGVPKPDSVQASAGRQLGRLLPYLARYRGSVLLGLLTLLLMGVVGAVPWLIVGAVFDSLAGNPQPLPNIVGPLRTALWPVFRLYAPSSAHSVLLLCVLLVVLMAIKGIFSFWSRWILIGISRDIEYDLRNDLLARLVILDPAFYVRNRTGELMSRATNDLGAVRMVLGPGIMYSANTIVGMVVAIFLMVKISPLLTLLCLLPVPLVALSVRYFGQVVHDLQEKIQAMLAVLSAKAQENLAGVRVVRAYRQEEPEKRGFASANRTYVARNMDYIRAWSMFFPALQLFLGVSFLIMLWVGGRMAVAGRISVGGLFAFYGNLAALVWPVIALGWVTNIFQRGAASMGRLMHIIDAEPETRDAIAPPASGEIRGEIEFRNLTFSYPTSRSGNGSNGSGAGGPVLKNINLHIPAGATVAIVGPTGCGKSTLATLAARLWDAPPDTVLIDGRPIREWPLACLRRAIGYAPQDPFLFSDTVRENIAFGVENASDEEVQAAAAVANIAADIDGFPAKYATLVGERGVQLSGGQKQRTALARAVIRDPRILILDDAFSSVDTDTEEKILRRLAEIMRRRTTLLISHRISTVKNADLIVVLKDGEIVERGSHDELVASRGYYADLHQRQLLEEELERE